MPKVIPQGPEGTIWFGGEPDEARLCLRVCGDDLDPDAVSRALGCQPSRSQRKGQPVLCSTGEVKRMARTSSWLLYHPISEEATVAEAIHALLLSLPDDRSVWASLTSRFAVDLICDLTVRCVNRGFELPPEALALVAERGITLGFDIFCQVDQRDVEALQQRLSPAESHVRREVAPPDRVSDRAGAGPAASGRP
jgi:hypothetical protein